MRPQMITSVGVGSGIDVQGLVEKLVSAEGDPVTAKLDRKEANLGESLTALGVFQGALTEFQGSLTGLKDPNAFTKMSLKLSDDEVIGASISGEPDAGTYDIQVERLAQQHRLVSGTFASDIAAIGKGSISLQFGEVNNAQEFIVNPKRPVKNIFITEDNNSLKGIQEAINEADAGVKASVLRVGKGFRLILSSEIPGTNNSIRVKINDDDGVDTDLFGLSSLSYEPGKFVDQGVNMRQTSAALNSLVLIDGVEIESPKNNIDDVISGVTLSLDASSVGHSVELKIFHDKSKVAASIQEFVAQYNAFIERSNELTKYDPESKEAAPLANDSSVRSVLSQIRRELGSNFTNVNSEYGSLASLGISTERVGTLTIDDNKVSNSIDNNITEVSQLFSKTGSSSDSLIRYNTATEDTEVGTFPIFIDSLPTQGVYKGSDVDREDELIVTDEFNSFKISVDNNESALISLNSKLYPSLESLADELQSKINGDANILKNGSSVSVSIENNHLVFVSQKFGGTSNVNIIEMPEDLMALTGLELVNKGTTGTDIQGAIGGREAIGTGRTLLGQGIARGLEVEVLGGSVGRRGTVSYSKGVAEKLDSLLTNFLGVDGLLNGKSRGLTDNLKNIADERIKLAEKLEKSEKQHLKTFSNLDALVGKMRSTGEYLERQLAALPGAQNRSK